MRAQTHSHARMQRMRRGGAWRCVAVRGGAWRGGVRSAVVVGGVSRTSSCSVRTVPMSTGAPRTAVCQPVSSAWHAALSTARPPPSCAASEMEVRELPFISSGRAPASRSIRQMSTLPPYAAMCSGVSLATHRHTWMSTGRACQPPARERIGKAQPRCTRTC